MTFDASLPFNPLVSIVIPVYNGANYLRESIESAINQTYSNIEVIVVNDGSTDNGATEKIALSYGNKIRYFSKTNGGCGSALNLGIRQMKGEYFSWLSHDDRYLENKIEWQIQCLSTLENKNTLLFGGYQVINSSGDVIGTMHPDHLYSEDQLNTPIFAVLKGLAYGCTFLIPKKCFLDIGNFDESLPTTQDYALWFDFFRLAPIHYDFGINTQYRLHPQQDTNMHPGHIQECNNLWIGFIEKISPKEKIAISGSEINFSYEFYSHLRKTQYSEAARQARDQLHDLIKNVKVSIIIPFRNRLDQLFEAIDSAQKQTHSNVEIILIDDGSNVSLEDLEDRIRNDARIFLYHQTNKGAAAARNFGIEKAKGKYIAFLDSDDLFLPEKIFEQLAPMEAIGVKFSYTGYKALSENVEDVIKKNKQENLEFTVVNMYPDIMRWCPIATPTVMGLREIFDEHQFPEHLKSGEDICLWINLASKHSVGFLPQELSLVRVNENSHALHPIKSIEGNLNIALFLIKDLQHSQHKESIANLLRETAFALDGSRANGSSTPPTALDELTQNEISTHLHHRIVRFTKRTIKPFIPLWIWNPSAHAYRTLKDKARWKS